MDIFDLFMRLGLALGVGLLVGLERGWKARDEEPGGRTAGVRTFAITGLLGGALGAAALELSGRDAGLAGGVLLGFGLAAYTAALALFSLEENRADGSHSVTTVVAGMVTFSLGAYAMLGDVRVAAAGAVAVAGVLAARGPLHGLVERVTWEELRAGLVLLAMTAIALPLLPDERMGPFGGVNPREIWTIAIVLAAVSFAGYAAVKVVGEERGVLLSAAAGGLVSSTAIMLTNARRAASEQGAKRLLAAGAVLATGVSIFRLLAIVFALNPALLALVWPPLAAAGAVAVGGGLLVGFRATKGRRKEPQSSLRNPFELRTVLTFAVFLGFLEMISTFLAERFGDKGAILTAVVAGAGDGDAVVVSMAQLSGGTLSMETGALAVAAGVASHTLAKAAVGAAVGRGAFALMVGAILLAAIGAGGLAWFAMAIVAD